MTITPAGRRRRDALPENIIYGDKGCDVSPACLSCPLPVCRYDVAYSIHAIRNVKRNSEIIRLYADGVSARTIARQFGVHKRTIFRVLAQDG